MRITRQIYICYRPCQKFDNKDADIYSPHAVYFNLKKKQHSFFLTDTAVQVKESVIYDGYLQHKYVKEFNKTPVLT
jgi:hypothetical protein